MTRLAVETTDPEEARDLLRQMFAVRIGTAGAQTALRIVQDSIGGVDLASVRYGMDVTAVTEEPLAATFIALLRAGQLRYRFGDELEHWTTGDVFVAAPAGARPEATIHACDVQLVVVPPAAFAAVAQGPGGSPPALTGRRPVSDAAARRWLSTVDFAQRTAAAPEVSPLVASATARLVAATALATFPHDAQVAPIIEDRRDARPPTVRRAVDFIETHPDRDLTVVHIAEAAHVTPRALQLAFRRHLDTTPMAYLRRVRLDRTHRELRSADPADVTVTAVARRWGFADPSRFTRQYRATYGQTPGVTLHG